MSFYRKTFFFFAVDSTDLKIDAVDGSDQLLGTAIVVYLEKKASKVPEHVLLNFRINQ